MQLAFDSADRLVELVEEHRAPVPAEEAAPGSSPWPRLRPGSRASCSTTSSAATPASPGARGASRSRRRPARICCEEATYVVVDLETTGLAGAVADLRARGRRIRALEPDGELETFVNPGERLPVAIQSLTGIRAPTCARLAAQWAVRRFLEFAGDAVLVAHNALRPGVPRPRGGAPDRPAHRAPVVDTVSLRSGSSTTARRGSASPRSPTSSAPPSARATVRSPTRRRPRSCSRCSDSRRARRADGCRRRRTLGAAHAPRLREAVAGHGAPRSRASTSSATRTTSCSTWARPATCAPGCGRTSAATGGGPRSRPRSEAVERIEWRVHGSELEAALEEVKLIREPRPPANVRGKRQGSTSVAGARAGS